MNKFDEDEMNHANYCKKDIEKYSIEETDLNENFNEDFKEDLKEDLNLLEQLKNPPKTLELCLKLFEKIHYNSWGFPVMFLMYDYNVTRKWSVSFENPANFENPKTDDDDPLKACHKMFEFLYQKLIFQK
jgi:hypothetical protein